MKKYNKLYKLHKSFEKQSIFNIFFTITFVIIEIEVYEIETTSIYFRGLE